MREFFKQALLNLYIYCGNRQAEKMSEDEIKLLLDALERMSKLYNYIPEERQKEIINNCLLTDKEYQNINVRTVSKWLEVNGKHYFKEEAHHETEIKGEIVTGEKRQEWLEKFAKAVLNATQEFTGATDVKGSGSRLKENIEQATGIKRYVIDGIEIYAISQEEAELQRKQIV